MSDQELPGIDRAKVTAWLEANVAGAVGPFTFSLIAGGRSNLTFRVTGADGARYVLRRPPLGHVLATAHDMGREHKIISGVGRTSVPVAPALGLCDDVEVNGAPFYVMGLVDGVVLESQELGLSLPRELRVAASDDLIDVLVRLHAVDPDAVGLGDLGRKEAYLERQLKRWTTQWERSKTRELPVIDQVQRLLAERMPPQIHTGIVHGDYRLGNCLTNPADGHIAAVLDWELCTLGDQLADLGHLLVFWSDPGTTTVGVNDPSGVDGFPSKTQLLERYEKASGRDLSAIGYYEAFCAWRLACIGEGVLNRYKAGVMGDEAVDFTAMEDGVRLRCERALRLLEQG